MFYCFRIVVAVCTSTNPATATSPGTYPRASRTPGRLPLVNSTPAFASAFLITAMRQRASTYSMPFMTASVVAEGRDNAIYHTVYNNSKDETLP
jgi:hypothetical protein